MSLHRLEQVFRSALSLPDTTDPRELRARTTRQWDSVGHMILITELETEFGIALSTDDILALETFDSALAILKRHGIVADR